MLHNLLEGNYATAADTAALLNYSVVAYFDTADAANKTYYMLKATGTNYWGTYVYNPSYCRTLVVQSPHPIRDFNTGKEGATVFRSADCFFFCLSGTSRCNHASFSGCDGTTSICTGSSESYRISDLAHNDSTIFQTTTDTLVNKYSNTYFLQLHGFTKTGSDPYVILSNGTDQTPNVDYVIPLSQNLEIQDTSLSYKIAHVDLAWDRLRGFGNSQGRLINAEADVCNSNATSTSGRFIHMEQEKSKLRADESGWNKVANAVTATFLCGTLPVNLLHFRVSAQTNGQVLIEWHTASETNNDYFLVERSTPGTTWTSIEQVDGSGTSATERAYQVIDESPPNGLVYYRLLQTDFDGVLTTSQTQTIRCGSEANKSLKLYPNPTENLLHPDCFRRGAQGLADREHLGS